MNRMPLKWQVLVLAASLSLYLPALNAEIAQDQAASEKPPLPGSRPAKLHRAVGSEKGDLLIGADGIEFRPSKRKR